MNFEFFSRSAFFDAKELISNEGLKPHVTFDDAALTIACHNEDVELMVRDLLDTAGLLEDRCDDEHDQFRTDAEADANALASAGMGTDEDYGYFGGDED